jgi:Hint domain
VLQLPTAGHYQGLQFQAIQDASGSGTAVELICFCKGTMIETDHGAVRVEALREGEHVRLFGGGTAPVIWIGHGRVLSTRWRRTAATPVIVRKGALADNVPNHDLRVTKAHALFVDDVLIPVEFLVNHRSILWDDHAGEVSIYHVELEEHGVLIANGAPAESYRDDGNRWLFQNANSGWHLPPQPACAPILTGGPAVDAVWRRLLDRSGVRPNLPVTEDPDLHLMVDGVRVDPTRRDHDRYTFQFGPASEVRLVSRSAAPQELGHTRDPRCLGVAVREMISMANGRCARIKAEDVRLTRGFWGFEPVEGIRWTNGDAVLPGGLFEAAVEFTVVLGGATLYPDDGATPYSDDRATLYSDDRAIRRAA